MGECKKKKRGMGDGRESRVLMVPVESIEETGVSQKKSGSREGGKTVRDSGVLMALCVYWIPGFLTMVWSSVG